MMWQGVAVHTFLVTGVSGAGQSTLARRLAGWGHHAVSADGDDRPCAWTAPDGVRVARPHRPDASWLAAHEWRWDNDRLDQIIAEAARLHAPTLWICGWAANAPELAGRVDAVFLLEIDQQTMRPHR